MFVESILVVAAIPVLFYLFMTWKFDYWKKRTVPFIEPRFPAGSFPKTDKKQPLLTTLLQHSKQMKGQPYYGMFFFRSPILVVQDPDLLRSIMIKDFDFFVDRNPVNVMSAFKKTGTRSDKIWRRQMTSASGEEWKDIRTTFTPIFTSGKMKAMMLFMQATCKTMIDHIDKEARAGDDFELKDMMGKYSMDTIASCAFGVDAQAFTNKESKFVDYGAQLLKQEGKDFLKILAVLAPGGGLFFRLFGMSATKAKETEYFYDVVMSSLKARKESKTRRNDLVDMMLDAVKGELSTDNNGNGDEHSNMDSSLHHNSSKKPELDELTIVATAIVILVAGYDTTGTTLSFALYELAKNPELQERLHAELEEVVGDASEITYDHIQSMTFVEQVIFETLRFHTPIPFLQRATTKPYKLPGSDLVLEEDFQVWINSVAIHFDPKHYDTPNEFNPEHFSKENKAKRHPYAFQGFGQGPRNCIGMRFALLEAKLGLANIVRKFNLLPSPKTKEPIELDAGSLVPYAKDGLYIKVEPRQH